MVMGISSKRENPIVTRSRAALIGAAKELLATKPAASISITDVVTAAGMSRPTFYQHFEGLGSLFATAALVQLEAMFTAEVTNPRGDISDQIATIVQAMAADGEFYFQVYHGAGGTEFYVGAVERMARWLASLFDAPSSPSWEFLAAGFLWSIAQHLEVPPVQRDEARVTLVAELTDIAQNWWEKEHQ